ncbi:MAG: DNA polymerase III subunit gamma/tau [Rhodospirillales bacterium]|nr:DNA polymerase III subunit gamma/tau [Rhodospirillales bacterium]
MAEPESAPYQVLARKYRPTRLSDLVGQEALVRTLASAIESGRIAHAFMLTGVRGVGKTTTARIVARALNCVGTDGKGGPTIDPCGVCEHCRAIAEDKHLDVVEIDAASNNGVDDVRELIEAVRYRPVSARYKIYIVDEVHMLSKNAWNALLKTLEEPPAHAKFLFATTEIRKVPVTVLSRCQRFDLRRFDQPTLARHLAGIAEKEKRKISAGAAALLARAADGSARDGLSLLDRALAAHDGEVSEDQVRTLLGLVDRAQVFDLFEEILKGEAAPALARAGEMYANGAEPKVVVEDLLEVTNLLTRLKVAPALVDDAGLPETERTRGRGMAEKLGVPVLARTWQILLKGLVEVQHAPQPLAALEMLIVRLAYAANLPAPGDLVDRLSRTEAAGGPAPRGGNGGGGGPRAIAGGRAATAVQAVAQPAAAPQPAGPIPQTYAELVALVQEKREGLLYGQLFGAVRPVSFEPGRIEIAYPNAPRNLTLPNDLAVKLREWTGMTWLVSLSSDKPGDPTLAEQATNAREAKKRAAAEHPLVAAVLEAFPGATIEAVRGAENAAAAAPEFVPAPVDSDEAPPDAEETWIIPDSFEPEYEQ